MRFVRLLRITARPGGAWVTSKHSARRLAEHGWDPPSVFFVVSDRLFVGLAGWRSTVGTPLELIFVPVRLFAGLELSVQARWSSHSEVAQS